MNLDRLKSDLIRHESMRLKPYTCPGGKITIGVGRNLTDNGISEDEAYFMLDTDIREALRAAKAACPTFAALTDARREVLVNMAFNMGGARLRGFKKMLTAIQLKRYAKAANEMIDSKWAKQVGERANELAVRMRIGV